MTADNPASGVHPHADKFRVVTAALVGIAVAALAIAVVVVARNSGGGQAVSRVAWSPWSPADSGMTGETEIADHLAPYYRFSASQQMDLITPIAVSYATASGATTGNGLAIALSDRAGNLVPLPSKTVAYEVCGLGATGDCALPGTATTNRMLLLRREALELALYTFKYVRGANYVVVSLPPGHTTVKSAVTSGRQLPVTTTVAFTRAQLAPELQLPLSRTLAPMPPEVPELASWKTGSEAGLVDQVTANALFTSQVQSLQTGGQVLVLNQLPPQ